MPLCLPPCSEEDCTSNRFDFYKDRKGHHVDIVLLHFKNDSDKGKMRLQMAPKLLPLLAMNERAAACHQPATHMLFCKRDGGMYGQCYWSATCTETLSLPSGVKLNANKLRHMFATAWRDFVHSPGALEGCVPFSSIMRVELTAAAAGAMLNSVDMWDKHYDDSFRHRGMAEMCKLWPRFVEFVKEAHLDQRSQK